MELNNLVAKFFAFRGSLSNFVQFYFIIVFFLVPFLYSPLVPYPPQSVP